MLTREEHVEMASPFVAWAHQMTQTLENHLDWEGLVEYLRIHSSDSIGIMVYVLLEQLVGRPSYFHNELVELLSRPIARARERTPMRQLEYHMVRHLQGAPGASEDMKQELSRTLLASQCNALFFSNEDAYDITHAVMYALSLGSASDIGILGPYRQWLADNLAHLMLASALDGDFDLGGELLISCLLAKEEPDYKVAQTINLLLDAIQSDGSISGPHRETNADMDAFDRCYHTTQVCLVALAEALVALKRQGCANG